MNIYRFQFAGLFVTVCVADNYSAIGLLHEYKCGRPIETIKVTKKTADRLVGYLASVARN